MSRRPCSAAKRAQRSVASGGSSTHSQAPKSLIHYIPAVQQTSLEYERPQISHEIILPKYIMDLIWCWAGQRISNHNCIFFKYHRTFLLLLKFLRFFSTWICQRITNSISKLFFRHLIFFSPRLREWLIACFFFSISMSSFLGFFSRSASWTRTHKQFTLLLKSSMRGEGKPDHWWCSLSLCSWGFEWKRKCWRWTVV